MLSFEYSSTIIIFLNTRGIEKGEKKILSEYYLDKLGEQEFNISLDL